jgi:phosphomevalonate kinase
MIGIVDIKERLNKEKQLEDLRDSIRARRKDLNEITVQLTHGRTREGG